MNVAKSKKTDHIKHFRCHQVKGHEEFKSKGKMEELQQPTFKLAFKKLRKFPKESLTATTKTGRIVEFIIPDDQPLLVIQNVGFFCLFEYLKKAM